MEPVTFSGVIVNGCYGGFTFSDTFKEEYEKRYGTPLPRYGHKSMRTDENAVALFKELGSKASSGHFSSLHLEEVP